MEIEEIVRRYRITRVGDKIRFLASAQNDNMVDTISDLKPQIMEYLLGKEAEAAKMEEEKNRRIEEQKKSAMRMIEVQCGYQIILNYAILPTDEEKMRYAEWFRPYLIFGFGAESIYLDELSVMDIGENIRSRKEYSYPGCDNTAWEVTEDEWNDFIALNAARLAVKAEKERQDRIESLTRIKNEAEAQEKIYTKAEVKELKKEWNDIHNEGGWGYVPDWIDIDTYNYACKELESLLDPTKGDRK